MSLSVASRVDSFFLYGATVVYTFLGPIYGDISTVRMTHFALGSGKFIGIDICCGLVNNGIIVISASFFPSFRSSVARVLQFFYACLLLLSFLASPTFPLIDLLRF